MKRASFHLHQSDKHQRLLQEFLDLQKEFVSKKRELNNAKESRDTLIAEIRFLRRRHKHLLQTQPAEEVKDTIVNRQKPVIRRKSRRSGTKMCGYDVALDNKNLLLVPRSNSSSDKVGKSGLVADAFRVVEKKPYIDYIMPSRKVKEKSTKTMINDKRIGKKMAWEDPLTLKV